VPFEASVGPPANSAPTTPAASAGFVATNGARSAGARSARGGLYWRMEEDKRAGRMGLRCCDPVSAFTRKRKQWNGEAPAAPPATARACVRRGGGASRVRPPRSARPLLSLSSVHCRLGVLPGVHFLRMGCRPWVE
jgi:hypothetical protein